MPIKPVHGGDPIPLDGPDDVAILVGHLERGDRDPAWLGDHFAWVAGTRPEWFRPHQETTVGHPRMLARLDAGFGDLCVLLEGASDRCVEILHRRLGERWSSVDAWALAAVGTDAALAAVADDVRRGGDPQVYAECGIWLPPDGPAQLRFTPRRRVVIVEAGDFPGADQPVGLPVDRVVRDPATSPVVWHYASLRLSEVPGLPAWPDGAAHLVAPAAPCMWTLFASIDADGRYHDEQVVYADGDGPDEDYAADDPAFGRGRVLLRPYGPDLIYSNGHVDSTPGVVGTAGGPPIGLYPNPCCPSCERLMFHAATVENHIREHGDGLRSLYLCEDCHRVAVTATGWN